MSHGYCSAFPATSSPRNIAQDWYSGFPESHILSRLIPYLATLLVCPRDSQFLAYPSDSTFMLLLFPRTRPQSRQKAAPPRPNCHHELGRQQKLCARGSRAESVQWHVGLGSASRSMPCWEGGQLGSRATCACDDNGDAEMHGAATVHENVEKREAIRSCVISTRLA